MMPSLYFRSSFLYSFAKTKYYIGKKVSLLINDFEMSSRQTSCRSAISATSLTEFDRKCECEGIIVKIRNFTHAPSTITVVKYSKSFLCSLYFQGYSIHVHSIQASPSHQQKSVFLLIVVFTVSTLSSRGRSSHSVSNFRILHF